MKTKFFTIALAFTAVIASAQITVTDVNLVSVGDIIYQAYDSIPSSAITVGNAGANQTWDFSDLQVHEYDTTAFIDPLGTPFASAHPTANLCVDSDGEYLYIKKDVQGMSIVGFDNLPFPKLILPLPLTYGANSTVGPVTIMDSVFVNVFLADSLAPIITLGQAQQIDSIKILVESSTEFNVDAYGNMTIPMGTYAALRMKTDDITVTDYFLYCTDTIFGINSGWYPMPAVIFPSEVEVTSSFQWWTNDAAVKFSLVQIDVDSLGFFETVDFLHNPATPASVASLSSEGFNIYPIPATNKLTIETINNNVTTLKLIDMNGKLILNNKFNTTVTIDVSNCAKGIYYLNLTTNAGVLTKQIIVE
jgi:hypothetical protein